jgi:hypothetical protein
MPKLTGLGLSYLTVAALVGVAGAVTVGCGDNKPKASLTPDGGDGGGGVCSGSFISPANGVTLTAADDVDKSCTNQFQIDVRVATSLAEGTAVDLAVGAVRFGTSNVSGAEVLFKSVQLSNGTNMLTATAGTSCSINATVTVDCSLPACNIVSPKIDATHVALNGVPVANGGNRVSAIGNPYQVEFDVTTNVEDGQRVALNITNPSATGATTVVQGTAVSGKVTFPGVTLIPDGNYAIEAECTNKAGTIGRSAKGMYPVDSTPPALTISSPANGKFFGPTELTNGAFQVCAKTSDKDATNLPAALGDAAVKNLSVAVGTGSPSSIAVTATDTDTCVSVPCTSSTPIDLTVALRDAAGNPTTKTITQVSCATTLPGVQIVSPAGDATPFNDPTKHLLASSSTRTFKDQDATKGGAQWTVVACADKAGSATLFGGAMGGALTVIAGPVNTGAAAAGDNCPNGYSQVAKFPGASLPDSQENTDGSLSIPTEFRVDVITATSATGSSPPIEIWVDSSAPNIQPSIPSDLCGIVYQSLTANTTAIRLLSTTPTVTMTVTTPTGPTDYPPTSWLNGFASFSSVTFPLGVNQVTAIGTDLAGNSGALMSPCTVTVGTPPIVTFVTPQATNTLCASGSTAGSCVPDGDGATAGWQGDLDVTVTVSGIPNPSGTVDFTAGTTDLGTATIDGTGHARLTNVTIPEGRAVILTAATTDISSHGIGTSSETLVVDTVIPDRVTAVVATVKERRQTSFHLAWTAPADGGQPLFSYIVKVSKSPITPANFDAGTTISYSGSPAAPAALDGIDATGLLIENNYYFAVASVDAAGNRGTIATAGPSIAHFNMKILTPPAGGPTNERFGSAVDGVADVNGDGKSDLLVGTISGQRVYIYNGTASFNTVTAPTTVITGQAAVGFGRQFIDVGDIDADGKDDYAISAPLLGNGKIYIFKGRAVWNATYTADSDADYILDLGATYAATQLGNSLSRLGDFNGDGVDDFAATSFGYNGGRGRVVIVLGRAGFSAASLTVQTIDGDPAYPAGNFGGSALGMGRFYTATGGTTLVVNANAAGVNSRGRVYAFHGISGGAAAIVATAADNFVEGPADSGFYGATLGLIGSVGGGPGLAISTGKATSLGVGIVDLHFGSSISGPFVPSPLRFTDSLAVAATDLFGRMIAGSAFPGTSITVSIIGDGKPDVVLAPNAESSGGPGRVYIVDGARLFAIGSPADVVTTADVVLPLPADWKSLPLTRNGMIRDLDGDGYGDFAVGESVATEAGRLAVFW